MRLWIAFAAAVTAFGRHAAAQAVFAHVVVGNNGAYTVSNWESDIQLAASKGIDAFVLNIAPPLSGVASSQSDLAFQAAANLNIGFQLFFSFDYLGGGIPWATGDILTLLNEYGPNETYYKYDGKPFVSTFEGPTNSDVTQWATINSTYSGGIYFVPDWTSQGPGYETDLYDGAFSWNMWPDGPNNISTAVDTPWTESLTPAGKSYMMGVSPWFFTDLPAYDKAFVWRGDSMWYDRWQEVLQILPPFVEIVTWNDFGESHYIGPIFEPGIPQSTDADALPYVEGFPHQAWLEMLPYQIAAYKNAFDSANPAPSVAEGEDMIVYWYRTAPADEGTTDATGNDCPSSINTGGYQTCYPVDEILEDGVFAIAMLSAAGSVSIAVGDNDAQEFDGLVAGINYVSRPFNGQTGNVTVTSSTGVSGEGISIDSAPASGTANFNAWVGCAGNCP